MLIGQCCAILRASRSNIGRISSEIRVRPEHTLGSQRCRLPAPPPPRALRRSVKPITVLVSACGSPGTATLVRALRENGEREVRLVGTDISERSVGDSCVTPSTLSPRGTDPAFAHSILDITRREGVDVVLPQSYPVPRGGKGSGGDLRRGAREARFAGASWAHRPTLLRPARVGGEASS